MASDPMPSCIYLYKVYPALAEGDEYVLACLIAQNAHMWKHSLSVEKQLTLALR